MSDPADASKIVKKGHFTYEQAKNLAKAGTVESLTYDAVNGVVISASAFGVSAVITFAICMWDGEDADVALKASALSGLKVGGTTFVASVIASQMSKAGLNSLMVEGSVALAKAMGPKVSAALVNAFRSGAKIYGAAAVQSAAKLLRGNVVTAVATTAVLSALDVADIVRGRISGGQLAKNVAMTASSVAGGTVGWVAGAAVGSMVLPGVGTVVGGLVASVVAGGALGKLVDLATGAFVDDDAKKMMDIVQEAFRDVCSEYLLNRYEAEKVSDAIAGTISQKTLKDMHASADRAKFARGLITPHAKNQVKRRNRVSLPTSKSMEDGLVAALEEIAEMVDREGDEAQ